MRTTVAGQAGYKVTGPNGNSIFLPAAGVRNGTSKTDNDQGDFWSSSPYQSNSEKASIIFTNTTTHDEGNGSRYIGLPVRPVVDMLSKKEKVTRDAYGQIAGHAYVDLGLSVKWATCNIGANSPSDYGDYYAWGEAKTKAEYTKKNSATYDKKKNYVFNDAAKYNWGGTWRLPTNDECQELVDNCIWQWTTVDGHNGYRVTSKKNGNSIFLPAAGRREDSVIKSENVRGYYWSSKPVVVSSECAYEIGINVTKPGTGWGLRSDGQSIRPVTK